ncbi:chloramphenicol phosphotransferase CPT family protein [Streptomyces sp. CRN 30]|uniref:chloramphenicol phosphotransferase CPT family protein n=1 Tax=Streptomyces sp. CRN 30 TaxID=3075613 RepID=UPI002A7FFA9B|nr:AAA family ATPase [Streptomyces sp. CRN 30]
MTTETVTGPAEPVHARIPDTTAGGTVILLNGTSSSGKTSIARELLSVLDGTWFHMPVDAFHGMRGGHALPGDDVQAEIDRTCKGFHRAVAGMAAGGNRLVVDYPLSSPWRLLDLLDLLDPQNTVLIGVHCPLPELERRERERGDRQHGLAATQYDHVHAHGVHDLDIDTSLHSPAECALRIRDVLTDRPRPTAFERLRRSLRP